MNAQPTFFDFAAEVGLTKHIGGIAATETLLELCHIGRDSYVLDVGCGVGVTACYLAEKTGCRVVGVDILEKMVERSRERAIKQKLTGRVEFKVADAQNLPFGDDLFDAVLTESVTAFPEDKQTAVSEYARVTKPGGYVGLNESAWLKVPPPLEVVAWAAQEVGASVSPLTPDEWSGLLVAAGLQEIVTKTHAIDTQVEAKGILQRYGWGGLLRVMGRMLLLYAKPPPTGILSGGCARVGLSQIISMSILATGCLSGGKYELLSEDAVLADACDNGTLLYFRAIRHD